MTHKRFNSALATIIFLGLFFSIGCATKNADPPSYARMDPQETITAPHADQLKKDGSVYVRFPMVFPPEFLTEDRANFDSIFTVTGVDTRDSELKIKKGFTYFKKGAYEETPWGLPLMETVFPGEGADLESYLFLLSNLDGKVWLASPMGEIFGKAQGYDHVKLENDIGYRAMVFLEIGMSLKEIALAHQKNGLGKKILIQEMRVGSKEWSQFEKEFALSLTEGYETTSGKLVASNRSQEEVQAFIKSDRSLSRKQRFLEVVVLPIVPDLEVIAFSALSQVATFLFRESVSNPKIKGNYASATTVRSDQGPDFKKLVEYFNKK